MGKGEIRGDLLKFLPAFPDTANPSRMLKFLITLEMPAEEANFQIVSRNLNSNFLMCFRYMRVQTLDMKVQSVEMVSTKHWLSLRLYNRGKLLMRSFWKDILAWVC